MPVLEFFYDFSSPYAYLASTQVEKMAQRTGATLRLRPFLLGGVFKATGNTAPILVAAKAEYMVKDLARWSRRYQVPFRFPSEFPVKSLLALRTALAVEKQGKLAPFTHAAFRAVFVDDQDIGNPETVAKLVASVGLDGAAMVAAAANEKDALARQTQDAVDHGSFGAPTFVVGKELFVGNDRLDFVEEALRAG